MIPWTVLGTAPIPGGEGELRLARRGAEFSISLSGRGELMNSRVHSSEDALAELAVAELHAPSPRVLVGGLGMGFTLAAALRVLPPGASVTVAELVPAVVDWNEGALGECAGWPVRDPRAVVRVADVADVIAGSAGAFDAVLLDVDNGPEGLTHRDNDRLYSRAGLAAARRALRPGGVLAVWSAHPSPAFTSRLRSVGFDVRAVDTRARQGRGSRHVIWLART
ncbi:hypothetical protein [Deinococcus pimensis]|uniref:hypothetical protein n=1 Tax=Deinococcus pimensis TaxID=309888 RepID=UPI000489B698|nr:hypothetical protein [Deinococcus pimensis]